jgi:hypothetical protein
MHLNKSTPRKDLGITQASAQAAYDANDITKLVNVGDGAVGKSYEIVEEMVTSAGKFMTQIHKWNAATIMRFVQHTYGLQLVTGLAAAKRFANVTNIIGTYLAYFTFIAFMAETLNEWGLGNVPIQPAGGCPAVPLP